MINDPDDPVAETFRLMKEPGPDYRVPPLVTEKMKEYFNPPVDADSAAADIELSAADRDDVIRQINKMGKP